MKDDRLLRVIVLGGIALAGATSSVASCASQQSVGEGPPPEHEIPHEGPPPELVPTTDASSVPTTTIATPEPTAAPSASAIPSALPLPHREGPPPPPPRRPPVPKL